jgi:rRNA processing protein Krr1/Pno1
MKSDFKQAIQFWKDGKYAKVKEIAQSMPFGPRGTLMSLIGEKQATLDAIKEAEQANKWAIAGSLYGYIGEIEGVKKAINELLNNKFYYNAVELSVLFGLEVPKECGSLTFDEGSLLSRLREAMASTNNRILAHIGYQLGDYTLWKNNTFGFENQGLRQPHYCERV